jgi:hypothetical protein
MRVAGYCWAPLAGERHYQFLRAAHDVVVGEDVPLRVHDDAGADTRRHRLAAAHRAQRHLLVGDLHHARRVVLGNGDDGVGPKDAAGS